jgi:hypothetical protein
MTAFCIQEFIIPGLYAEETAKVLKIMSDGAYKQDDAGNLQATIPFQLSLQTIYESA